MAYDRKEFNVCKKSEMWVEGCYRYHAGKPPESVNSRKLLEGSFFAQHMGDLQLKSEISFDPQSRDEKVTW